MSADASHCWTALYRHPLGNSLKDVTIPARKIDRGNPAGSTASSAGSDGLGARAGDDDCDSDDAAAVAADTSSDCTRPCWPKHLRFDATGQHSPQNSPT